MGKAPETSVARFREARFGMFIHYGLYSMVGRHEWILYFEHVPFESEWVDMKDRFNPETLDPRQWVALAQEAGMRYLCLTTRHLEGFCLFNTKTTDFNSVSAPLGRDLVAEYCAACREAGMRVGLYYSVAHWGDPGFRAGPKVDPVAWQAYVATVHEQLRELMTNYGPIDYLFYDGCPPTATWRAAEINAELRRLQPGMLISDRCGLDEDIASAEQHTISDPGKYWESCQTANDSWGYNHGDHNWKTPFNVVKTLLNCAHNGGNFLFNVGPMGDGTIPAPNVDLLRQVGAWTRRNAEAVYGTAPHPFDYCVKKLATARGNTAYIPLHYYHGPETVFAWIDNRVEKIRVLGTNLEPAFRQEDDRVFITGLPASSPDPIMTVLALELDGPPRGRPTQDYSAAKDDSCPLLPILP